MKIILSAKQEIYEIIIKGYILIWMKCIFLNTFWITQKVDLCMYVCLYAENVEDYTIKTDIIRY